METEPTGERKTERASYWFPDTAKNTLLKLIAGSHIALHLSTTIVLGIAVLVLFNKLLLEDDQAASTRNSWSEFQMIQITSREGQPDNDVDLLWVFLLEFLICSSGFYLSIKLLHEISQLRRSVATEAWLVYTTVLLVLSSINFPLVSGIEGLYQSIAIKCLLGFSICCVSIFTLDSEPKQYSSHHSDEVNDSKCQQV